MPDARGAQVLLDGNFLHACVTLKCARGGSPAGCVRTRSRPRAPVCQAGRRARGGGQAAGRQLPRVRHQVRPSGAARPRPRLRRCVRTRACRIPPHPSASHPQCAATAAVAKQLDGLAGGLQPPASAADSIAAAVGAHNAEHFFVGTQDEALRERLRKARWCSVCFVCYEAAPDVAGAIRCLACRSCTCTPPAWRSKSPQKRSAPRRCVFCPLRSANGAGHPLLTRACPAFTHAGGAQRRARARARGAWHPAWRGDGGAHQRPVQTKRRQRTKPTLCCQEEAQSARGRTRHPGRGRSRGAGAFGRSCRQRADSRVTRWLTTLDVHTQEEGRQRKRPRRRRRGAGGAGEAEKQSDDA